MQEQPWESHWDGALSVWVLWLVVFHSHIHCSPVFVGTATVHCCATEPPLFEVKESHQSSECFKVIHIWWLFLHLLFFFVFSYSQSSPKQKKWHRIKSLKIFIFFYATLLSLNGLFCHEIPILNNEAWLGKVNAARNS